MKSSMKKIEFHLSLKIAINYAQETLQWMKQQIIETINNTLGNVLWLRVDIHNTVLVKNRVISES